MNQRQIQEEALNAVDEYTCSCTVAIASTNPEVPHGSGVAVMYDGGHYILSAAHVLLGEPDNDKIRVIGRPDGPLQLVKGKQQLAEAVARGTHAQVFSSATAISIADRLSDVTDDIAALKVSNPNAVLHHTLFHDLSGQGIAKVSIGEVITIFGFPGELAQHYEHAVTGRRGWAVYPHVTMQTTKDINAAPERLSPKPNPKVDLITDFEYPEDQCEPRGMSGCGMWTLPGATKTELWSAGKTQLLGILTGHYRESKLLRFVRIDRVLQLLATGT